MELLEKLQPVFMYLKYWGQNWADTKSYVQGNLLQIEGWCLETTTYRFIYPLGRCQALANGLTTGRRGRWNLLRRKGKLRAGSHIRNDFEVRRRQVESGDVVLGEERSSKMEPLGCKTMRRVLKDATSLLLIQATQRPLRRSKLCQSPPNVDTLSHPFPISFLHYFLLQMEVIYKEKFYKEVF